MAVNVVVSAKRKMEIVFISTVCWSTFVKMQKVDQLHTTVRAFCCADIP
jgi:hypothetical protein